MGAKEVNILIKSMSKIQKILKNYNGEFNLNLNNNNCLAILNYKDDIPDDLINNANIMSILNKLKHDLKIDYNNLVFNQNIIAVQFKLGER